MSVTELVFETHSTTADNENSLATGWLPGRLSPTGRQQARSLGSRRRHDGLAAVFTSDLARAIETVEIALDGSTVPVLHDWRLRECDYGDHNGCPPPSFSGSAISTFPIRAAKAGGRQPIASRASSMICLRGGRGARVLVVGHTATRWGLDRFLLGAPLEKLLGAPFEWKPGWEYVHEV